jgi:succinate dehydrogenase / fumarate reductase membrane anchor subunit
MGNGTSIGRVRGLGSARTGAHHWLVQRWTAIGNLVLVAYLAVSLLLLPNLAYQAVAEWIASPVPAAAIALLIVSTFWHARLGLQVFIEDYLQDANRIAALIALNLITFAGAAFGLLSIVRLALGGA